MYIQLFISFKNKNMTSSDRPSESASNRDFLLAFGVGASIASAGALLWWLFSPKQSSLSTDDASAAHSSKARRTRAAAVLTREVAKIRNLPPASSLSLSNQFTNERLVYRLWMDRSFRLKPNDRDPFQAHVRSIMLKAFWDSVKEDGDERKNFSKVKVLLDEVVSRINGLTPNRVDLKERLERAVDTDHIITMIGRGVFNAEEFSRVVASVTSRLLELEAPAYNKETREWVASFREKLEGDTIDMWSLLRSFIDFSHSKVEQIALGAANYRLTLLIPFVDQHGLEYLRTWIDARVERGELTFVHTAKWANAELASDAGSTLKKRIAAGDASAIATAFFSALTKTCWFGCEDALPETLLEDTDTIMTLRRKSGIMLRAVYACMRISQIMMKYNIDDWGTKVSAVYADIVKMITEGSTTQTTITHEEGGKRTSVAMPDVDAFRKGAHARPAAAAEALLDTTFPEIVVWAEEDRKAVHKLLERGFDKDAVKEGEGKGVSIVQNRILDCVLASSCPLLPESKICLYRKPHCKVGAWRRLALANDIAAFAKAVKTHGQKNLLLFAAKYNVAFIESASDESAFIICCRI